MQLASPKREMPVSEALSGIFLSLLVWWAFAVLDCLYEGVPVACLGVVPGLSHGLGP